MPTRPPAPPDGDVTRPYHHGDLRRTLLDLAADVAANSGPSAVGLRDLARRAGVSHAAPAHHFGDRRGLLTALATEGFAHLAGALEAVAPGAPLTEQGVAYVTFAVAEPGRFAVMWRFDELDREDAALTDASRRAWVALTAGAEHHARIHGGDPEAIAAAAWSFAHGLATLVNAGQIDPGADLARFVRATSRALVGPGGVTPK